MILFHVNMIWIEKNLSSLAAAAAAAVAVAAAAIVNVENEREDVRSQWKHSVQQHKWVYSPTIVFKSQWFLSFVNKQLSRNLAESLLICNIVNNDDALLTTLN